jgi:hypothetical protein
MRAILFAMLVAIGVALLGTSNLSAAPANGSAIGQAATATDVGSTVQHWRWGSGGFYGHGARRSHYRRGSVGPVCRTVCQHRPFTSARVCTRVC